MTTIKKSNESDYSKNRLIGWSLFAALFVLGLCPYLIYQWKVMTITIDRTSVAISTFPLRSCIIESYACQLDEDGKKSGKEELVSQVMSTANLLGELRFDHNFSKHVDVITVLTFGHEGEQGSRRVSTPFDEPVEVQSAIIKNRSSGVKNIIRTSVYVKTIR